ncbi:MAG: NAD(P)-dependent oxidoreductase, partial [Bacteriovoracaceae bacterium]|nr:NAD(P)-dependent oxidoreductase [Bacteriovoracaceae bacterium]
MRQVSEGDLDLIFSHALSSLQQMKGENIFITGGTGFFGKWLLEVFIHANQNYNLGIELHVLSRNPSGFVESFPHLGNHPFIHFVQGDLESFSFPAINCSYIIHAATDVSTSLHGESLGDISESILAGTKRVLEFAKVTQATKVLLTSSGAVYGTQP